MEMLIFFLLLGIILGSFFNACIYRTPLKDISVLKGTSHCPKCKHKITWKDNIPIFSYVVLLRGKCRYCKQHISLRYPLIELLTGIIYVAIFLKFGYNFIIIKWLIFVSILIVLAFIDIDHLELPDSLTIGLIIIGFIFAALKFGSIGKYILGSSLYLFPFFLIYAIGEAVYKKEVMGFGDLKLVAGIGMFLGFTNFFTIYIFLVYTFVIGAVISLILLMLKKAKKDSAIPFGPFIIMAAILILFFH